MEEHRKGMNFSTKKVLPIELIYFETFVSKKDAFQREKRLKQYGGGMRNLKMRLKDTLRKRKGRSEPRPS
jgi:predicted GIY-YIG superfamily endonuclease